MTNRLNFSLVSPERELFSGEVDQVVAPGVDGDFGVLPGHAPFMSTIRTGAITVLEGGNERRIFIRGGFADVTPAGLTILAEEAIAVEDIDLAAAQQGLKDAEEDVADAKEVHEREHAEAQVIYFRALVETKEAA